MDGILHLELAIFHLRHSRAAVIGRYYAMDPARERPVNKSLNRNRLFSAIDLEIHANLFLTYIFIRRKMVRFQRDDGQGCRETPKNSQDQS